MDTIAPIARQDAPGAALPDAPRVLVVDDEQAIADLVAHLLAEQGMLVRACYGGRDALEAFACEPFDLVILDLMMPDVDGLEVCRELRRTSDVPIVFLSARDEEADQVIGLTLGADDYVTKPFRPREFVARIKARLRRRTRELATDASADTDARVPGVGQHRHRLLAARGIEVDVTAHSAHLHDMELHLTPKEFSMLALLLERAGSPVSARELFEQVWGEPYDDAASNTVLVHVRRLRKKLAEVDASQTFIETVWGVGYKVVPGPDELPGRKPPGQGGVR